MNKSFTYHAAGGVVIHRDRMLLLDRPHRGEVRLPKGHVEKGESAERAALRETAEESGYADLSIIADLGEQTVEFDHKGEHVTRHERYFLMRLLSERPFPRSVKDAAQFHVLWVALAEAPDLLTYEPEKAMARRAIATVRPASL
jgi:8-oxo-dGTP pyrophosphatase MutT (NUDIX family)